MSLELHITATISSVKIGTVSQGYFDNDIPLERYPGRSAKKNKFSGVVEVNVASQKIPTQPYFSMSQNFNKGKLISLNGSYIGDQGKITFLLGFGKANFFSEEIGREEMMIPTPINIGLVCKYLQSKTNPIPRNILQETELAFLEMLPNRLFYQP